MGFFNNANKNFASFDIVICIIDLCFCKFIIGIRHLSIKIIYASRTGQMIGLYNTINSNNPDQKPDYKLCFLSIYPPYL